MRNLLTKRPGIAISLRLGILTGLGLLMLGSCTDTCNYTYIDLTPQYTSLTELRRQPMTMQSAREVEQSGKIYIYQNILLMNEVGEGIHIFNNTNPENPTQIGFLGIPGNVDMAINNGVLYADSYLDLVTFDVSDWNNPVQLGRLENLYPSWSYPLGDGLYGWYDETSDRLVTGFSQQEITDMDACGSGNFVPWVGNPSVEVLMVSADMSNAVAPGNGSGQGGSMARFTMAANRLYAVDQSNLQVVSLNNPEQPTKTNEVSIGWGVETIFPYKNLLLFGTTTGVIINSLDDPDNPEFLSTIWHATACDPVVVQNDMAYYTIRGGNACGENLNQLGVIDIRDPSVPVELATFDMDGPYGLGIDGDLLFVCEGDKGLKLFDASEPTEVGNKLRKRFRSVHAWDVIPHQNTLMMVGEDGLYQYDYTDPENITLLSHIATK